jgi:hypothetical protein
MEIFIFVMLAGIGANALRLVTQRRRIALLGAYLGKFQIEKHMETLTEGYLRALGEDDLARRDQIWNLLSTTEEVLREQFSRFVAEFSTVSEDDTRVSRLTFALPYAERLFPSATFDLRKVFSVHARGILSVSKNEAQRSPRDKAFTMTAELLLMQHSCHWFCQSKAVASARLQVRQKTTYQQVIDSVSPETRQAYRALTGV